MPSSPEVGQESRLLTPERLAAWDAALADDDTVYAARYPGPPGPGPVHTVYVPVPRYSADTVTDWGATAVAAIAENHAGWHGLLAELTDEPELLAALVLRKLQTEPIEDLRIDLEDGFRPHRGASDDADEDAQARRSAAAAASASGLAGGAGLPRSWGLRIRSLAPATRQRGLRTLAVFLEELLSTAQRLPAGFVITLPKVTSAAQVQVFCEVLAAAEDSFGLTAGTLRFEIQVEAPQTVLAADGTVPVAQMIHAAGGRVSGLHFGTYDYTASLGILAEHQNLRHPAADFAKSLMMLAAAETGVRISDGSDNKIPVGAPDVVAARWRAHAEGVQRALRQGLYQGWDLHPAQLPTRFAATFAFLRSGWSSAAVRLADYHHSRPSAAGIMDEPATAFALARHLATALACGAVEEAELMAAAGIGRQVVDRYLVRGAPPPGPERGTQ